MAPPAQPPPNQAIVPWILYGALFSSTGIYLLVLHMQMQSGVLEGRVPDPTMVPALGVVALGCALVSIFLPRHFHKTSVSRMKLEIEEVPDPDSSLMLRDGTPTVRVFADPDKARQSARAVFFTPFILRLSLAQSVAIYGLVLGFMGAGWVTVLPFFVVCWVIYALNAPRDRWIYGPVEDAHDARFLEEKP